MKSRIMLAVLGCVLAACSDQSTPLAPDAAGSVSLSQGGAPTPIAGDFVDELASAVCGFTVLTEFTGKQKVLALPNGRVILIFPAYTQTWTNASTGRTVIRSLTGSFHINPLATRRSFSQATTPFSTSSAMIPPKAFLYSLAGGSPRSSDRTEAWCRVWKATAGA